MTPELWPPELSHIPTRVLRAGFEDNPANNILRSDMEDGFKTCSKFSRGVSNLKGKWRFKSGEFEIFRIWVRDNLKDGTRPIVFAHPFRRYLVAANFVPQDGRAYKTEAAPAGNVIVSFEVDYLDRALA